MDGFDGTDAMKDVGVHGLMSYEGEDGGDLCEVLSILFKFKGEGVRLVHKSNGVSSDGFLCTDDRQVPFAAIDDMMLERIRGERWDTLGSEFVSWLILRLFTMDALSDISFWY